MTIDNISDKAPDFSIKNKFLSEEENKDYDSDL